MEDLSAFIKRGFIRLHQNALEKDYKQKTIKDRREDYSNIRKKTRDTLMLQKRNIDPNNFTPICTPELEKKEKLENLATVPEKSMVVHGSKRLEMLKKWKINKEKKKLEEKKKLKPLFKVFHVPVIIGLPDLENVNKEIKGKPIKKQETFRSKFAPKNHKFTAPKNILPMHMRNTKVNNTKLDYKMNSPSVKSSKKKSKVHLVEPGKNINITARTKNNTKNCRLNRHNVKIDKSPEKIVSQWESSESLKKVNNLKEKPSIKNATLNKTPENKKHPRGEVMWNNVKIIESNNEVFTDKISTYTPRKKYRKTPMKKPVKTNSESDKSSSEDSVTVGTKKMDASISYDTIPSTRSMRSSSGVTPRQKSSRVSVSSDKILGTSNSKSNKTPECKRRTAKIPNTKQNKQITCDLVKTPHIIDKGLRKDAKKLKQSIPLEELVVSPKKTPVKTKIPRRKSSIYTPRTKSLLQESSGMDNLMRKMTASPSFDGIENIGSFRKHGEHKSTHSGSTSDEDNFISSRILKPSLSYKNSPLKKLPHDSLNLDADQQNENDSRKEPKRLDESEKVIFYSDDEMTLKTPIKMKQLLSKSVEKIACKVMSTSTPSQKTHNEEPPIYISPFVTISRGKESARKEFQLRISRGGTIPNTPAFSKNLIKNTSPTAGAGYFSKKLNDETEKIQGLCLMWTTYREQIPEGVQDMVDAAIGQSTLLISKKFQQFKNLIRLCEEGTIRDKPVTCTDLHGYWDTIYMQVEDIDKRFNNLQQLKDNNWKEVLIPEGKPIIKRTRARAKKTTARSKIKEMINNARRCKSKTELKMVNGEPSVKSLEIVSQPYSAKKRQSLRISTISSQATKRLSSSPGLAMLRVSQAIKQGDGITPSKSILKTNGSRSETRNTKSVLFKDLEEDKENSFENTLTFSPVTPRRSNRRTRVT